MLIPIKLRKTFKRLGKRHSKRVLAAQSSFLPFGELTLRKQRMPKKNKEYILDVIDTNTKELQAQINTLSELVCEQQKQISLLNRRLGELQEKLKKKIGIKNECS